MDNNYMEEKFIFSSTEEVFSILTASKLLTVWTTYADALSFIILVFLVENKVGFWHCNYANTQSLYEKGNL